MGSCLILKLGSITVPEDFSPFWILFDTNAQQGKTFSFPSEPGSIFPKTPSKYLVSHCPEPRLKTCTNHCGKATGMCWLPQTNQSSVLELGVECTSSKHMGCVLEVLVLGGGKYYVLRVLSQQKPTPLPPPMGSIDYCEVSSHQALSSPHPMWLVEPRMLKKAERRCQEHWAASYHLTCSPPCE